MIPVSQNATDDSNRLRIAIIPAGFDPRLSYNENVFAQTLHDMGHEVMVFTSYHGSGENEGETIAMDATLDFCVVRTGKAFKIFNTTFSWDSEIQKKITCFKPDVALVLAPNHGLGMQWVRYLPDSCRVIAGFSDLPWHRGFFRAWVKRNWSRRVIARAWKVVTATKATEILITSWARAEDRSKIEFIGLPFRGTSLDGGIPPPAAAALAARVDKLIVCVTRVHASKNLEQLFKSVERFLIASPGCGFVMAGFDNGAESNRLRSCILASPVVGRCEILPVLNAGEIGGLFNIADCSIWSLVSIGIYHSLHCGCPVIVREGQDATHLLADPAGGAWFRDLDTIDKVLPEVLGRNISRRMISKCVSPYEAESILSKLLEGISPAVEKVGEA